MILFVATKGQINLTYNGCESFNLQTLILVAACVTSGFEVARSERSIQDSGYSITAQNIMRTAMKIPSHILPTLDEIDPRKVLKDKSIGIYIPEREQAVGVYVPRTENTHPQNNHVDVGNAFLTPPVPPQPPSRPRPPSRKRRPGSIPNKSGYQVDKGQTVKVRGRRKRKLPPYGVGNGAIIKKKPYFGPGPPPKGLKRSPNSNKNLQPIFQVAVDPTSPVGRLYNLGRLKSKEMLRTLKTIRPRPIKGLNLAAPVRDERNRFDKKRPYYDSLREKDASHPYEFEDTDFM